MKGISKGGVVGFSKFQIVVCGLEYFDTLKSSAYETGFFYDERDLIEILSDEFSKWFVFDTNGKSS